MGGPRYCYRVPEDEQQTWWTVKLDGFGEVEILDPCGDDPLRHPDPWQRLVNRYAAGHAPMLRYALGRAAHELERANPPARSREGILLAFLYSVLHESRPLVYDEMRALHQRGQLALYLERAA